MNASLLGAECIAITRITGLEDSYKTLVARAEELVKEKGVDEFRRNLTLLPMRMQDREEHLKYIEKYRLDIYRAETVNEIFGLLNLRIWNYLNYHLLQHILHVYGDEEIKKVMRVYATAVEEFKSETTLRVFLNIQSIKRCPNIPSNFRQDLKEIMFEHPALTVDSSLADIDKFRHEFTDEYSLLDFGVILAEIKTGCIVTMWLVPPAVATIIMESVQQGNIDFLLNHEITELKIDGLTIYPPSELTLSNVNVLF